jgi:hypothetical protein
MIFKIHEKCKSCKRWKEMIDFSYVSRSSSAVEPSLWACHGAHTTLPYLLKRNKSITNRAVVVDQIAMRSPAFKGLFCL